MNVQGAKITAGRPPQKIETLRKRQQGALFALGVRFVIATLWKLFVLRLLLTLTLNRMVSVLLKSQVHRGPNIVGCQMSLEPKSALYSNAQSMLRGRSGELLDSPEYVAGSNVFCVRSTW